MSKMPDEEVTRLVVTRADAQSLAAQGAVARGYLHLLSSRDLAAAAVIQGEPWGRTLAEQWQRVLDDYLAQYVPVPE